MFRVVILSLRGVSGSFFKFHMDADVWRSNVILTIDFLIYATVTTWGQPQKIESKIIAVFEVDLHVIMSYKCNDEKIKLIFSLL